MSYRKLEIWHLAREIVIDIHNMTLNELPKFEMFETGSQIRRSSKSIKANIVEGYSRHEYKQDYIKFLFYALSSNNETCDHLETLYEVKSLKNKELYNILSEKLDKLGRKLYNFIKKIQAD